MNANSKEYYLILRLFLKTGYIVITLFIFCFQYVVLMSQALLVFNPYVGWATYLQNSHKMIIHIAMQVVGSALAIAGSLIKMTDESTSWNSPHAWLGEFISLVYTTKLNIQKNNQGYQKTFLVTSQSEMKNQNHQYYSNVR